MITLEELKEDYDWRNVLSYAGVDDCLQGPQSAPNAVGENPPSAEPFGMDDVAAIIAASNGEADGENWMIALQLKDERYAYIEAGCDYTGWDCQAGGSAWVASSLPELIRWALSEPARARLELPLPEAL